MQTIPLADGDGQIEIYENGMKLVRNPPKPEPTPANFMTPRMSEKVKAEIEGGQAAIKRHEERVKWAREFNASRAKPASEVMSEAKEAQAEGFNMPFSLNPGNHPVGMHTTEGDPAKSPHASKVKV